MYSSTFIYSHDELNYSSFDKAFFLLRAELSSYRIDTSLYSFICTKQEKGFVVCVKYSYSIRRLMIPNIPDEYILESAKTFCCSSFSLHHSAYVLPGHLENYLTYFPSRPSPAATCTLQSKRFATLSRKHLGELVSALSSLASNIATLLSTLLFLC